VMTSSATRSERRRVIADIRAALITAGWRE
jgi:hypothetical protein